MRFLFINHLQNAHQSIKANRLRSFLTTIGITIGIASITSILALSAGANSIIRDQVDALGGNIAVVRPGANETTGTPSLGNITSPNQGYATSTLTSLDLKSIQETQNVSAAAPLMILGGSVVGTSGAPEHTPIVVSTPELAEISDLVVKEGQFLDSALTIKAAVIGAQLSVDLFGTEDSIGKTATIKGEPYTVIGILERINQPINFNTVDFDTAAIIDIKHGRKLNQDALSLQQINVQVSSVEHLSDTIAAINKSLLKNHLNQVDFSVLSGDKISQPTSQLFDAIAGASIAIALISLFVGGIGIMNIMLVGVAERTRELGIRKAVGATHGDIISQFLIESLTFAIFGGISGYVLGYIIAFAISSMLTFDPIFTWQIAATALATSLVIGVVFGLYPAIRAARKDPIAALRQYE